MPVAARVPTAVEVPPFRLFPVHVVRTELLTPGMVRVTLGGEELAGFVNGGRDQRIKLLLPLDGQTEPVLPEGDGDGGWYRAWQRMPAAWRPVMRTYTVRAQRAELCEVDVDLALHDCATEGPASRWARAARGGDRLAVFGPTGPDAGGVEFQLPADARWVLLAGDETALPAVAAILESLPAGLPARVYLRVPDPAERQPLPAIPAVADVRWLYGDERLVDAIAADELPSGTPYAWIAGEAGQVRALRRHLVDGRGFARGAVTFMGYWRRGRAESDA